MGGGAGIGVGGNEPLVSRARHAVAECERDRALLGWLARFRFVTAELAGDRFDVSREKAALRLRRLVDVGHVERHRTTHTQRDLFSITTRGADALRLPPRRPPRTDANREHELALVWLATRLERAADGVVMTEREIRQREAAASGHYSVQVIEPGRSPAKRWPDLVIEDAAGRTAVELERAPKGTARLQRIARAYVNSDAYDTVRFIATTPSVAARLARCADAATVRLPPGPARHRQFTALVVEPWPAGSRDAVEAIATAIASRRAA